MIFESKRGDCRLSLDLQHNVSPECAEKFKHIVDGLAITFAQEEKIPDKEFSLLLTILAKHLGDFIEELEEIARPFNNIKN